MATSDDYKRLHELLAEYEAALPEGATDADMYLAQREAITRFIAESMRSNVELASATDDELLELARRMQGYGDDDSGG